MLRNYLLTAWKVLLRRKFFTFISLFGITITLSVLLILSTALDNFLHPSGPEKNNHQLLYVERLTIESRDGNSSWSSEPGYRFLKDNVRDLKTPEKMTFFSQATEGSTFVNGNRIESHLRRTDTTYWEVLDFNFIDGRAFDQTEFDTGQMVAVVNQKTQNEYFGGENPIGKNIKVNEQSFLVIGVVEDVFIGELHAFSDIWVPYSTFASTQFETEIMGGWSALLYHSNPSMLPQMQQEYTDQLKNNFVSHDPEQFNKAIGGADTKLERIAREMTNAEGYESGAASMITMGVVLVLCFMLLPSINLINLNISRIMERSSEIGVRKAFGAKTGQLVIQFVVENILITAVGGLLALLVSWGVLSQIEASGVLPGASVSYNWRVFIYGLTFVFVFGLLSGTYPALKMSKLHPVTALKGGVR